MKKMDAYDYTSTRRKLRISAKDALLQGLSEEGGLFVTDALDTLSLPLEDMLDMSYPQIAQQVMQLLLPGYTKEEIAWCIERAYGSSFSDPRIAPVIHRKDLHVLELFHGPTCAFKDLGLQMLPQLMSIAAKNRHKKVMILTATSGDTGKAALEGFKDAKDISITVFYPKDGVSSIQEKQMTATEGNNTCVCALKGNFDDAQSGVKTLFADEAMKQELAKEEILLSSANSINIGRLIPQVVYYVSAYVQMVNDHQIAFGDKIDFCVPSGNFGNVLAGYYAKCMGLPVRRFFVASNANRVLCDFLSSGVYERNRDFYKTISPSMDILISSNLERLLYYKSGKNSVYVAELMEELAQKGSYAIDQRLLEKIREDIIGGYCKDAECIQAMKECYERYGYVIDPHTAVGYHVMKQHEKESTIPCILVSTASPYKFSEDVVKALFHEECADAFAAMELLQEKSGIAIPEGLRALKEKKIRHKDVITREEMKQYVLDKRRELMK